MTATYRLSADSVEEYLRARGIVGVPVSAQPLDGGVSGEVLAVTGPGVDLVVKQALPQLRVARHWLADPRRILIEADALRLAGRISPADVPAVVDVDDAAMTLTISRADRSLRNWKADLLAGRADPRTAVRLGQALATWHTATAGDPGLAARLGAGAFVELRIEPFYHAVRALHPRIDALAAQLLDTRLCLVHGDFSPKNVLADGDRVCVLDWEVAHYGYPVFDLAFLTCHLVLKAVHGPAAASVYRALFDAFLETYAARVDRALHAPAGDLAAHAGCLMLARVDGASPAGYLTEPERARVRAVAGAVLDAGLLPEHLWELVGA
jgi:tRNA A-37 threonylcarbamoyl transferase component Bud32